MAKLPDGARNSPQACRGTVTKDRTYEVLYSVLSLPCWAKRSLVGFVVRNEVAIFTTVMKEAIYFPRMPGVLEILEASLDTLLGSGGTEAYSIFYAFFALRVRSNGVFQTHKASAIIQDLQHLPHLRSRGYPRARSRRRGSGWTSHQ